MDRKKFCERYRLPLSVLLCGLTTFCAMEAADTPAPSELEDPVLPLVPSRKRTEAEQDHLDGIARFAAGRVAAQRGDDTDALRQYQRAARLDPDATAVLREIVPLAFALEMPGVAVRYALKVIEKDPADPLLMRRLAAFITDQGEQEQALLLYERAAEAAAKAGTKPNASSVFTDMEMGRLYYLAKKYNLAADRFAAVMGALDKPADFGLDEAMQKAILGGGEVTYQLFGEAFLDAGKFDDAAIAYEKANVLKADAPLLALNQARVALKKGEFEKSLTRLQEYFAAKRADQGVIPYKLLADNLSALGKSAELKPQLEVLRTADPKNIPLRYFLAEEYQKDKELDKAEALYRELIEPTGERPPIEAYRGLTSIYAERGAVELLLKILGESVGRTGALESLDEAAKKVTANTEQVNKLVDLAQEQLQKDPTLLGFGERLAVAELALSAKRFDDADKWFDLAMQVRTEKTPEPVLSWGLELFLGDRFSSAAKVFRRTIDEKLLPADNPAAHYYLAGALEMEGKTDEAVAVAREGAALRKDAPRFVSRTAWILYHAKRFDEAEAEYRKLLESFDGMHDTTETRDVMRDARLVLSNIAVMQNDMPAAEEWLEQVLDEFPDDIGAHNDLGYLYADQNKRPERALRMTQFAVAAEPENSAYRDSLGWAFYRLGRYEEAVKELRKSLELEEEPDGVLYEHLGDALAKAGDSTAAKDAFEKAIAAFEKSGDTKKAEAAKAKVAQ